MITNYIGKTIGNRVLVVCKDKDGNYIQTPHIDYMKENGFVMVSFQLNGKPDNGIRYLTQKEVACFIAGRGTDGSILETPAKMKLRLEKEHKELMKDPKFRAVFEQAKKELKLA